MNFIDVMVKRRSVRAFDPNKMPDSSAIDEIIKAGTYAPCGRGRQSPIIIAITNKEVRDRLSELNAFYYGAKTDPFYGAPVVLAVLADRTIPTHLYDGSLVMGNLLNAACAVDLGSCWIHRCKEIFDSEEGKAMLAKWGIEGDYEGIGFCVVGYALSEPKAKERKDNYVTYVK